MKQVRERIDRLAARLPAPADYYAGASGRFAAGPRQVLLFHRRQALHQEPTIHRRFVLLTSLYGTAGVIVDGRMHILAPGRSVLIFPYQAHHYARFRSERISWLFTTFDLDDPAPLAGLRNRAWELSAAALGRLEELARAFAGGARTAAEVAPRLCLLLESCLAGVRAGTPAAPEALAPAPAAVRRAAQFIQTRLGCPFRLAEVAKAAAMSESHLRRVFRATLGMSPGRYARRTRLAHAASLLRTAEMNITQVAEAVGFGSVYAFSNAFRKYAGVPPLDRKSVV
jgi:AraC family transcriptional regulator of arabinose operon